MLFEPFALLARGLQWLQLPLRYCFAGNCGNRLAVRWLISPTGYIQLQPKAGAIACVSGLIVKHRELQTVCAAKASHALV